MSDSSNSAEIARKTLRLLATRRIAPTPQNYQLHFEEVSGETVNGPTAPQMRDLLAKTMEFAVNADSGHGAELVQECEELAQAARAAHSAEDIAQLALRLKKFWFRLDAHGVVQRDTFEAVVRLLRLLVTNTQELLADDVRLGAQVEALREIAENPIDLSAIQEAERRVKELIFRQGTLRHSMNDAQAALKNMISNFIERVGRLSDSTGEYGHKLEGYVEKLGRANDINQLNTVIADLLSDTNLVRLDTARTQDELIAARREVEEAESRVRELEKELEQTSALVSEDALTGALNRRGLDDAFEREAARADRHNIAMCIALLDIDNFKAFNDTYGHIAGDAVLKHMIRTLRAEQRPGDIVARYGGEEFVLLLPGSTLDAGVAAMVRHQRRLTREIFMHNNERLLVTFSAGVVQREPGEPIEAALARADVALYSAKRGGKNRVCTE